MMQVPLSLVQKHLGHSSPTVTTAHYTPDSTDELREMLRRAGLLRMPDIDEEPDVGEEPDIDEELDIEEETE